MQLEWGKYGSLAEPDRSYAILGHSLHCGGGAGFVLSRGLLAAMRERLDGCMRQAQTFMFWYWDEVELSRCIYGAVGVNCTALPPWRTATLESLIPTGRLSATTRRDGFGRGFGELDDLRQLLDVQWASTAFMGTLHTREDWVRYEAVLSQLDLRLDSTDAHAQPRTITFHKADEQRMERFTQCNTIQHGATEYNKHIATTNMVAFKLPAAMLHRCICSMRCALHGRGERVRHSYHVVRTRHAHALEPFYCCQS